MLPLRQRKDCAPRRRTRPRSRRMRFAGADEQISRATPPPIYCTLVRKLVRKKRCRGRQRIRARSIQIRRRERDERRQGHNGVQLGYLPVLLLRATHLTEFEQTSDEVGLFNTCQLLYGRHSRCMMYSQGIHWTARSL